MAAITGEALNEMSTWEELRLLLGQFLKVNVFQGDLNTLRDPQVVWVESATSTNLPSGATQGIVTVKVASVNNSDRIVQTFEGTDGTSGVGSVRYWDGGWSAWG
jgi:hypothetical protein